MPHYRTLAGEKCYLSPLSPEDAERCAQWLNDLEITFPWGDSAWTPTGVEAEREGIIEALQKHYSLCRRRPGDRRTHRALRAL